MSNLIPENKIAITRPIERSRAFAHLVMQHAEQRGIDCPKTAFIYEPLFNVVQIDQTELDVSRYSGLILTSANAAPSALRYHRDGISVYCVGQATKDALIKNGLSETAIKIVAADARDLVEKVNALISDDAEISQRAFLYLRGQDISVDLSLMIDAKTDEKIVYEAEAVNAFSPDFLNSVQNGEIAFLPLFSKRSAEHFVELTRAANLLRALKDIKALCISDAVLESVQPYFSDDSKSASEPHAMSMVDLVLQAYSR